MHYATIKPLDIANGPGIRVSLFVSGCRNRCKGCFNPETWSFTYGQEFTLKTLLELDNALDDPNIAGLSILGGDPFEPENRDMVAAICKFAKAWHSDKSIWLWSGYSFEDMLDWDALKYVDVLVDGRFEEENKDLRLKWRGSTNQRVIDVPKSLEMRCAIRWPH